MVDPHTLSFWLVAGGVSAILSRRRSVRFLGVVALYLVAFGGVGGNYFRVADRHRLPVQPAHVARLWLQGYDRDALRSAIQHAAFALPAAVVTWRALRR